jgi:ABC-type uncharacterized transport system substrate-binding protein
MRRRDVIAVCGYAAAVWSRSAFAQQPTKQYRIGILTGQLRSEDQDSAAFLDELRKNGFDEGRNLRVDHRGIHNLTQLKQAAAEITASKPDVLVSFGSPATLALKETGTAVPIIFGQVADPVAIGVVRSLPRPGGNVSLQLLHDVAPRASKIGVASQPGNPLEKLWAEQYRVAAADLGLTLINLPVRTPDDVPAMLEAAHAAQVEALVSSPLFPTWIQRREIIEFAAKHRVPTLYNWMQEAREGGLMSYGPDPLYQARRTARYVVKVLGGADPGTLPVEQPTNLLFILNLRTARAMGIDFPPALLARADEVIE